MIHRDLAAELERAATWAPSITLTGPRQSGKTTLCQAVFPNHPYRSLESPDDRAFAQDDRHGAEIDLVVEESDELTLIEAKSAATPSSKLLAGLKRVRPHLQDLRPRCDAVAVYGGEESQQRTPGRLVPWRLVRSAAPPEVEPLVQVFVDGRPVADADVRALLPDRRWKSAKTDERGRATLELSPRHLPLTVFVAKDGLAAHEETAWIPDERALHVQLTAQPAQPAGGS